MMKVSRFASLTPVLLATFALLGFGCGDAAASGCRTVTDIKGMYTCKGQCVVTDWQGNKSVVTVDGETDKVEPYPGATAKLYKITITGPPPPAGQQRFHEVEIGALTGLTLRTATAQVSDQHYPVLEEDVFETDSACKAVGYTKIVRNPDPANFKTCNILCTKSGPLPAED